AKDRLERAMSLVYKVNQVGIAVAIEVIHSHRRLRHPNHNILVEHQRLASQYCISSTRQLGGLEVMMALYFQVPFFKGILCRHKLLYLFHPCWRVIIVDIRIVPRKALGAEQFFVIKRSVWFAELCVPLVGYFPQTMIRWHIFLLCRDTINRVHPPESLSEADAINRVHPPESLSEAD